MNDISTQQLTLQDPIIQKFERVASKVAAKYQAKFREVTKAHRRDRFIEWISNDEELWAQLSEEYFPDDESFENSYSAELENAIWGSYYDSLTNDEIRAVECKMRLEVPDFYFDDSNDPDSACFYSDKIVALRNEWAHKISEMRQSAKELLAAQLWKNPLKRADNEEDDPGDEDYHRRNIARYAQHDVNLRIITNIDMKYSPAVFICDTCGHHAYSHDETGHLIADIGMWALSNGEPVSYLACEKCAATPEVTKAVLGRLFAEREYYWRLEEERKERELRDIILSEGIDPDTGDPIDPQPDPINSNQTGLTSDTVSNLTGSQSTAGYVPDPNYTPRFKFWQYDAFMQRPPKSWKIENAVGDRDLVTIFGEAGSGKTFIVIDLIYSACFGRDWVRDYDPTNSKPGKFKIARPMSVAYCFGEGGAGLPDRFRAAEQYYGKPPNSIFFVEDVPQLYKSDNPTGIDKFVSDYAVAFLAGEVPALDLLIIDTQANATLGADENSSTHMAEVIANAQKAIKTLGCAVILIHHATKAGGTYRGSSVLHGAADCMIEVKKSDGGERSINCFKLKDGEPWEPQRFAIMAHSASNGAYVSWDSPNAKGSGSNRPLSNDDKVLQKLMDSPGQNFTAENIADKTGISASTVRRILGRLTGKGQIVNDTIQKGTREISVWSFVLTI